MCVWGGLLDLASWNSFLIMWSHLYHFAFKFMEQISYCAVCFSFFCRVLSFKPVLRCNPSATRRSLIWKKNEQGCGRVWKMTACLNYRTIRVIMFEPTDGQSAVTNLRSTSRSRPSQLERRCWQEKIIENIMRKKKKKVCGSLWWRWGKIWWSQLHQHMFELAEKYLDQFTGNKEGDLEMSSK